MSHFKNSKKKTYLKVLFALPVACLIFMSMAIPVEYGFQESSHEFENMSTLYLEETVTITKDFTDDDFDALTAKLEKKGITVKFKGIKRNKDGEITAIQITANSGKSKVKYSSDNDDEGIEPIKISYSKNNIFIHDGDNDHHDGYVYVTKKGKHKIHSDSKGKSVFVYSTDEDDEDGDHKIIVRSSGKNGKSKVIKRHKKIEVIVDEDGEDSKNVFYEINVDDEDGDGDDEDVFIIKSGSGKSGSVWVTSDDDERVKIKTIGKGKNKIFLRTTDDGKEPMYILNGKVVKKEAIDDLDSDNIETIEVLKGDSATEEYGKKAKDGVIVIKTKKQ